MHEVTGLQRVATAHGRMIHVPRGRGLPPLSDEAHYVATAQNLWGLRLAPGAMFRHVTRFTDPNPGSVPSLRKVILAGAIALLGNHPRVWRLRARWPAPVPLTTAWVARTWWP